MAQGYYTKGEVSEWHEGNFKTFRLHDAQVLINKGKINPFAKMNSYPFVKWGYEMLVDAITIMFGEGMSKYSNKEYEAARKLKVEVENLIEKNPVCFTFKKDGNDGVKVNKENWKIIKPKLEEYEYLVKLYNDKHGLSTKNVGTGDLF